MNLDTAAKKIFLKLQDDESRELFICRYNFFRDGNYEHLWDELSIRRKYMCNKNGSTADYKKDMWSGIINGIFAKRGCVFFGAGANARLMLNETVLYAISEVSV